MNEQARQALAEHIADLFNHGLTNHEIARMLGDARVAAKLGYAPQLADMVGLVRDLMMDRPMPDEAERDALSAALECAFPTDADLDWLMQAFQREHPDPEVWWQQHRDDVGPREMAKIFISIWEAGRIKTEKVEKACMGHTGTNIRAELERYKTEVPYEDPTEPTSDDRKVIAESFRQFEAMKAEVIRRLAAGDGIDCIQCRANSTIFTDLESVKANGWHLDQEGPVCPTCMAERLERRRCGS